MRRIRENNRNEEKEEEEARSANRNSLFCCSFIENINSRQ